MNGFINESPRPSADSAVWFVTGASKGIGRSLVEAIVESGDRVIAGSRGPRPLDQWATERDIADRVLSIALDVTDEKSVAKAVSEGLERFGRIDVLVNNAGYLMYGAVEELSSAEVQQSFGVNVFGLWNTTRAVLQVMRGQASGHIINMASISANVTSPGSGLYSATKAAVLMLTESLADEAGDIGVKATAICPGGVRTDFLDSSSARRADRIIDDYQSVHRVERALGRANHRQGGDPRKVAQAIIAVTRMDPPPRRLYLGEDALQAITQNQADVMREVKLHQTLSESITDGAVLRTRERTP